MKILCDCWCSVLAMMKLLDYYYLTLIRVIVGVLTYKAPPLMALTFFLNLVSLLILFAYPYIMLDYLLWSSVVINLIIAIALSIRYSTKRTKRIEEQYKDESRESRRYGATWVITYEILSVILIVVVVAIKLRP